MALSAPSISLAGPLMALSAPSFSLAGPLMALSAPSISLAGLILLAARRGPLDPATLGAAASSAPDLEHVLPFVRPGGRKLFHGRHGWHRSGRLPADLQLLLAGVILGALVAPPSRAV
jgi:hypothetical protein